VRNYAGSSRDAGVLAVIIAYDHHSTASCRDDGGLPHLFLSYLIDTTASHHIDKIWSFLTYIHIPSIRCVYLCRHSCSRLSLSMRFAIVLGAVFHFLPHMYILLFGPLLRASCHRNCSIGDSVAQRAAAIVVVLCWTIESSIGLTHEKFVAVM
jgi:hypothetical protein